LHAKFSVEDMNNLFSNPVDKMNDWDTKNQEKFLELENFSKYPPTKYSPTPPAHQLQPLPI